MKVMKFGGTSVGTSSRMKDVTKLVTASGEPVFIVLSAMSGDHKLACGNIRLPI